MVNSAQAEEQALLGAVLGGYKDLPKLARIVAGPDFEVPQHEAIWTAMCELHADGIHPDPLTVKDRLGNEALRLPGGPAYLIELQAPMEFQAPLYARKVRELSVRRSLASLGAKLGQLVEDADTDTEDLLHKARQWMDEQLSDRRDDGTVDIHAALEAVIEVTENGEPDATPLPWPSINDAIGGAHPGALLTVGARPGVGKSIFLENVATHVARAGKRVLFVSLEMSAKEITQRTLAYTARVPLSKVRSRIAPGDPDLGRIARAAETVTGADIAFADRPNQGLSDIRGAAWEQRQYARRQATDLGLIVIDYVQLVKVNAGRNSTRQQQIGELTRGLKMLAKELEVPVLIAAQLNRANQARQSTVPMLSDLREAGDIEQDSDVVFLLDEPTQDMGDGKRLPTGELDVHVAKNRHGATKHVSLQKWGAYSLLTEGAGLSAAA